MKRYLPAAAAVVCVLFAALLTAQRDQGASDVYISKDVMIPMRDGVRLAANIYRPAHNGQPLDGKFPVILTRTPYNKDLTALVMIESAAKHGYIVIFQDVRGRYKSEGKWRPIRDDGNDGFDTA